MRDRNKDPVLGNGRQPKYNVRLPTVLVTQQMKDALKSVSLRECKSINELVRMGIQKVIEGSTKNYLAHFRDHMGSED